MIFNLNDLIITKKQHACGCDKWQIVRTGADYKIKCLNCGRIVLLSPEKLNKQVKKKLDNIID